MDRQKFRFRVQLYDVNAFAELSSTALLRFLQQAATEASAELGFDAEWYRRQNTVWLIRRTTVNLHAPVPYRDVVEVRTWVSDIHRVRSQREYEVYRVSDGALAARASTDWVYVDQMRSAPVRPPTELQAALMPNGVVSGRRSPCRVSTPPSRAFFTERRVEFPALDSVPHVNNARYAAYLEQDLLDALAAHGWDTDPLAATGHLRPQHLDFEYYAPAFYRDRLSACVWVTDLDPDGFACEHYLLRAGQRLFHARNRWVWSNGEMPPPLREALDRLADRRERRKPP